MKIAIRIGLAICVLLVALAGALLAMRKPAVDPPRERPIVDNSVADEDKRLQQAAEAALGERDGSIVVLDVQTGPHSRCRKSEARVSGNCSARLNDQTVHRTHRASRRRP
jgi:hypothetical protein